jgi:hypothetical protein
MDKNIALEKAERDLRELYAELCFYYPQYKLEELTDDDNPLALGDINLLVKFARMRYYQDKLDMLTVVAAGNGGKKPYKNVAEKLERIVKGLRAKL